MIDRYCNLLPCSLHTLQDIWQLINGLCGCCFSCDRKRGVKAFVSDLLVFMEEEEPQIPILQTSESTRKNTWNFTVQMCSSNDFSFLFLIVYYLFIHIFWTIYLKKKKTYQRVLRMNLQLACSQDEGSSFSKSSFLQFSLRWYDSSSNFLRQL